MATYYVASPRGPLGPYDISQLRMRMTGPDDLVWTQGMPDWAPAVTVPELKILFNGENQPPLFDKQRFNEINATTPEGIPSPHPGYAHQGEQCPPTYLWLAIVSFLGSLLFAIIALYKSLNVKRSWAEGNYEKARRQSRQALIWSIVGLSIGIITSIFNYCSGGSLTEYYQNLLSL